MWTTKTSANPHECLRNELCQEPYDKRNNDEKCGEAKPKYLGNARHVRLMVPIDLPRFQLPASGWVCVVDCDNFAARQSRLAVADDCADGKGPIYEEAFRM